jgi:hypothetical protein
MFTLEFQLASPEEQTEMTAMEMLADEVSRVPEWLREEPTCNDAGWYGGALVNTRMFKTWLVTNNWLWNNLFKTEQYDSLVEEMNNPILEPMNHKTLFRNC